MPFAYEAIDANGQSVSSVVDAASPEEASEQLHARGLFVTNLEEAAEGASAEGKGRRRGLPMGRPGNAHDRMMLTRQMSMMLRAGSQVVPAMAAVESQIGKPGWREIVGNICRKVETGASLSDSLSEYPAIFDETFRTVIAAGESTGTTVEAFDRLAAMTKKQQEMKIRVIGALVYPAILLVLSFGVVGVLLFYVLPKFDDLYSMLGTPLPLMTDVMLRVSRWAIKNYILVAVLLVLSVAGGVVFVLHPAFRHLCDKLLIRLPVIKTLTSRIILAKMFRIWGVLVTSNVPVLDSLRLARSSTTSVAFRQMMDSVMGAVEHGDSIGHALTRHAIVPPTMSSAIATGEQSGQLGESLVFLADYLEEENSQMLAMLTRLVEPLILIIMGFVVGGMAISLFLPLFDLTSAVSGH